MHAEHRSSTCVLHVYELADVGVLVLVAQPGTSKRHGVQDSVVCICCAPAFSGASSAAVYQHA
jgi:hypothetical protein